MTPEQLSLLDQISTALTTNSNVGTADYILLHTIFWVSIVASAVAALLTATNKGEKWLVAVLAALPALCLTVENTFSFTTRYSIRNQAVLDLKALKRDIELKNTVTTTDGVDRLNKIEAMVSQSPLPRFATTDTKHIPASTNKPPQ